jgi:hypothetical protein
MSKNWLLQKMQPSPGDVAGITKKNYTSWKKSGNKKLPRSSSAVMSSAFFNTQIYKNYIEPQNKIEFYFTDLQRLIKNIEERAQKRR